MMVSSIEDHCWFARQATQGCVVAIIPRFLSEVVAAGSSPCGSQVWGDTAVTLPTIDKKSTWKHWLTAATISEDEQISVGEALDAFPVALLSRE